jgi:hypothetical protein
MNSFYLRMTVVLFVAGCGVSTSPHYEGEKTFGRTSEVDPHADSDMEGSDIEETDHQSDPIPPSPIDPEPVTNDEETPVIDEPTTSGHDLLGHYSFKGYFEVDTLARIIDGRGIEGELVSDSFLDSMVKGYFENVTNVEGPETLDLVTNEDGRGRQKVEQIGHTTKGDRVNETNNNSESQSGKQTLYWNLDQDFLAASGCPKTFVCVDRITWQPERGDEWTYCFYDKESKKPIAVPYSPNTHFGPEAFKAALGPTGEVRRKFIISKHSGLHSCDSPDRTTLTRHVLEWKLSLGNLIPSREPGFLKLAKYRPLIPDTEVSISYQPYSESLGRSYQPRKAPFIDQMSRFNSKIQYFLNSKEHVFVKMIRTVQAPTSGLSTWIANGMQVNYVFEFCTHKAIVEDPVNHCKTRP